jgi:putative tryptophan/tyrosine transport system substrate-binding protein
MDSLPQTNRDSERLNDLPPKKTYTISILLVVILLIIALVSAFFYWFFVISKKEITLPGKTQNKIYHVGILSGVDAFANIADGFKSKMTELGYIEGKNIVYDLQKVNADPVKEQQSIKNFIANKVDLIFVFPTESAVGTKSTSAGTNIPIIFALGTIEGNSLVDSIQHPGSTITGVRYPGPDLAVKRFELLMEFKPGIKRLYIAYDPNYPGLSNTLSALRPVVSAANVQLIEAPVADIDSIKNDLQTRSSSPENDIDGILIMPEILTQSPDGFGAILGFANAHNIPIAGSAGFEADMGAVFSYIPDNLEMGQLAAPLADKIFKGTPAGTISIVTPESRLRINYKAAQALGLTVSEGLLGRAVEIIR